MCCTLISENTITGIHARLALNVISKSSYTNSNLSSKVITCNNSRGANSHIAPIQETQKVIGQMSYGIGFFSITFAL